METEGFFQLKSKINVSNFYPLEVVGRGSETPLEVGKNLKAIIERFRG